MPEFISNDRVPLSEIELLPEKDYEARRMTALLNAIGDAVKHILDVHEYARDETRPQKALFVITTDGMGNNLRGI